MYACGYAQQDVEGVCVCTCFGYELVYTDAISVSNEVIR